MRPRVRPLGYLPSRVYGTPSAAGGIRTSKDAIKYLVTVAETVGEEWLTPHLFRFGASSLLNDVLLQRQKLTTGHYSGPDYVTID